MRVPTFVPWALLLVITLFSSIGFIGLHKEINMRDHKVAAMCAHQAVTDHAVNDAHSRIRKLMSKGLHDTEARIGTKKELPTDKQSVSILVDFLHGIHTIHTLDC